MAIITISREYGSGGDEVAHRLCEVLGYHAFGKAQITQAVEATTYPKYMAVDYSEDQHEVQGFLDRLFGRAPSPAQKIAWTDDPSIATRPERSDVDEATVLSLVRRAIRAASEEGNMVIVGRGGQVLLQGTPGVLHVRIEAPVQERIERIKAQIKRDQGNGRDERELLKAASDMIVNRDMASEDYIKHFYNVAWDDPKLYHLVLNLGKLNVEQAVQIIAASVHSLEPVATR